MKNYQIDFLQHFICLFFFLNVAAIAQEAPYETHRILYLIQSGDTQTAIELYQNAYMTTQVHDRELLQQMGLVMLDQGYRTNDPEISLLTFFGAGISANEKTIYILEEGLKSSYPQLQLVCLNMLMRFQNECAEEALIQAMSSPVLIIRLECAFHLCEQKTPLAIPQTEALMNKVDKSLYCLFPQFFAMVGNTQAIKILRRFLASPDEQIRIEAIRSIARYGRDDLLPAVRTLATHHHPAQLEACATALGSMSDKTSIPKLLELSGSSCNTVSLAAYASLYLLGQHNVRSDVERYAACGDLFAINLLGSMEGSEEVLWQLANSSNDQIQINAALALLERRDTRCLPIITKILIPEIRDIALIKMSSRGKSLSYWKGVSSAQQYFENQTIDSELSLTIREELLSKAINLPEKEFLSLAELILIKEQNDLVPNLVDLLENLQTPEAIALLQKYQQKAGAPLIRNYCTLALYRLKEPGNYGETLKTWVLLQQHSDFIRFRPLLPRELQEFNNPYQLNPQETSRLLIESFEALSQNQEDEGIYVLLEAIKTGNPKNKYALAGLLIRAAE